jgi:hypothetical protein
MHEEDKNVRACCGLAALISESGQHIMPRGQRIMTSRMAHDAPSRTAHHVQ